MKSELSPSVDGELRAGSFVLSVFENPLNTKVLRAHSDGPLRLAQLQEKVGWSAQTTLRGAVSHLCDLGALCKEQVGKVPYAVATSLCPAGEEMLVVADEVENWLARAPGGPIPPEGEEAKGAVKALAGGWSTTLVRLLASRSLTLTEMAGLIPGVSYPALERRISWMRATGQIEAIEQNGRGTPYVATDWLRYAIAPLCAAGRCERRHMPAEGGPVTAIEVEAAFLLSVPLVPLRSDASGTCVLAVPVDPAEPSEQEGTLAGVTVVVERGELVSCLPEVHPQPPSWAIGAPETWLEAVIEGQLDDIRLGGADPQLVLDLVTGIHFALFGDQPSRGED